MTQPHQFRTSKPPAPPQPEPRQRRSRLPDDSRPSPLKPFAAIMGAAFLLAGIGGFIPGITSNYDELQLAGTDSNAELLGLFRVSILHNLVHLAFGVWGVLAARSWGGAKTYAQMGGVIYLVLAVLGLVAPTTFGLIPIGGNDVWLHALLGAALAYFGFTARQTVTDTTLPLG